LREQIGQEVAMRVPATMRWLGLALLGILIAAGISIAASRLASQQIGLASQPISAGDALAPAAPARPWQHRSGQQSAKHQKSTTSNPSSTPSPPPSSLEPPAYSPPPSTAPSTPSYEPSQPPSHDGEQNGGGGADD
jgi:hypothetical protein